MLYAGLIDYLGTERVSLVTIHDDTDCLLIHEMFSSGVVSTWGLVEDIREVRDV